MKRDKRSGESWREYALRLEGRIEDIAEIHRWLRESKSREEEYRARRPLRIVLGANPENGIQRMARLRSILDRT